MGIFAIIPARLGSSRLPGKPLADICGRPMIVRVVERVKVFDCIHGVVVATDSEQIASCVEKDGYQAVMTDSSHPSGTDRIAQAASLLGLDSDDIVVNVQGDQPLVEEGCIRSILGALSRDKEAEMATAACHISEAEARDPNRVKVVIDRSGRALYFSRALIPFDRDGFFKPGQRPYLRHLGLYAYTVDFLQRFVELTPTRLELIEKLEQLRVLENGYKITVSMVDEAPMDVDTPEDLERIRQEFRAFSDQGNG